MSDEKQYFPWQEGQPTKPDVDALMKAFPPDSIKPGDWSASDQQIHAVIGNVNAIRYRTVYATWISRLSRDYQIVLYRAKTTGFYCPTAAEIYSRTHPTLEGVGRKIGKQLRSVSQSKPTSEVERITQDHHGKLLYVQKRELKKARMNLLPKTAVTEIPKIEPPKTENGVP